MARQPTWRRCASRGSSRSPRRFPAAKRRRRGARISKRNYASSERGEARRDLPSLTIKDLVEEFLRDPAVAQLRYFPTLEPRCAWWVNRYAAEKVVGFGVVKLREGRDLLRAGGRQPGSVNRFVSVLRSAWNWGVGSGSCRRRGCGRQGCSSPSRARECVI